MPGEQWQVSLRLPARACRGDPASLVAFLHSAPCGRLGASSPSRAPARVAPLGTAIRVGLAVSVAIVRSHRGVEASLFVQGGPRAVLVSSPACERTQLVRFAFVSCRPDGRASGAHAHISCHGRPAGGGLAGGAAASSGPREGARGAPPHMCRWVVGRLTPLAGCLIVASRCPSHRRAQGRPDAAASRSPYLAPPVPVWATRVELMARFRV